MFSWVIPGLSIRGSSTAKPCPLHCGCALTACIGTQLSQASIQGSACGCHSWSLTVPAPPASALLAQPLEGLRLGALPSPLTLPLLRPHRDNSAHSHLVLFCLKGWPGEAAWTRVPHRGGGEGMGEHVAVTQSSLWGLGLWLLLKNPDGIAGSTHEDIDIYIDIDIYVHTWTYF